MPKPKRSALVGTMVADETKAELERIAEEKDRSLSYVSYALLMRGLADYRKDGQLAIDNNKSEAENTATPEVMKLSTFADVDSVRVGKGKRTKGRK